MVDTNKSRTSHLYIHISIVRNFGQYFFYFFHCHKLCFFEKNPGGFTAARGKC